MKTSRFLAATMLLALIGCGSRADRFRSATKKPFGLAPAAAVTDSNSVVKQSEFEPIAQEEAGGQLGAGEEVPKAGHRKAQSKVVRKIKHSADLKLITDEFDRKRDELQQLIVKHDGYEAMADVQSSPGAQRVGTWRVRVPIEQFSAFRAAARKLAEVEADTVNTEDLTDQYYDLDANISNLKAEQESWREMLKKTSDKLENLISVKRELDRVSDEIQRKQGRLRLMANLTDLTTINLTLRERQKFAPDKGVRRIVGSPARFRTRTRACRHRPGAVVAGDPRRRHAALVFVAAVAQACPRRRGRAGDAGDSRVAESGGAHRRELTVGYCIS
jgi:hypothetical protein